MLVGSGAVILQRDSCNKRYLNYFLVVLYH